MEMRKSEMNHSFIMTCFLMHEGVDGTFAETYFLWAVRQTIKRMETPNTIFTINDSLSLLHTVDHLLTLLANDNHLTLTFPNPQFSILVHHSFNSLHTISYT